jgi:hypothetical protein
MKPGVFRASVAGMSFNISLFIYIHVFVCWMYTVIIHNGSFVFFYVEELLSRRERE